MEPQTNTTTKTRKNSSSKIINPEKSFSGFSVSDIEEAENFYKKTLGLDVERGKMGNLNLRLGQNEIFIYPKDNHEPATFTILNFQVADIEQAVDQLKEEGVTFEQYGGDIKTDENGIFRHSDRGPFMAWFKDPAGNILSIIQEEG
jgi:predicted enzyme related to lactoylglutathione lyase